MEDTPSQASTVVPPSTADTRTPTDQVTAQSSASDRNLESDLLHHNPNNTRDETYATEEPNFSRSLQAYQVELDADFERYKSSLTDTSEDHELDQLDWDELDARYSDEMEAATKAEQEVLEDFNARFQQFMLWTQVSSQRETERARKRLRTRMTFVQNSEAQLSEKQEHYAKVLQAFQNAMALLGNA